MPMKETHRLTDHPVTVVPVEGEGVGREELQSASVPQPLPVEGGGEGREELQSAIYQPFPVEGGGEGREERVLVPSIGPPSIRNVCLDQRKHIPRYQDSTIYLYTLHW